MRYIPHALRLGLTLLATGSALAEPATTMMKMPMSPAIQAHQAPVVPAILDPQQAELARLNMETRSLAGQISSKSMEIRSAQQRQWRGARACQGPLVVWSKPAEADGGFPLTAYDCSPYLCEAPGLCMSQCASSGQCAPGAQCIKTTSGWVCAPAK